MDLSNKDEVIAKIANLNDEDLKELFNPKNADALPVEALSFMETLSGKQIEVLGKAYPNKDFGTSYLILKDNNIKGRQTFPRSTWQNLHEVRTLAGLTGLVAMTFTSRFKGDEVSKAQIVKTSPVQDLSVNQVNKLEGLKTSEPQDAKPVVESKPEESKPVAQPQPQQASILPAEVVGTQTENKATEGQKTDGNFEDLTSEVSKALNLDPEPEKEKVPETKEAPVKKANTRQDKIK